MTFENIYFVYVLVQHQNVMASYLIYSIGIGISIV